MTIKVNSQTTLVFDLDDTLYKEIDFLKSAYLEIARNYNPKNYKHTYAQMFAMYRHGADVFEFIEKTFKVDKEHLIESYRNHMPQLQLNSDVENLLKSIKNCNGKIALLTDGRSLTQRNKIKALGLQAYCDHIVISEEIESEKPARENFKAVEDVCQTSSYYYIADNIKKDFITPNALGWGSIGLIDNGLNIHVYPEFYGKLEHVPDQYIFQLKEINIVEA